MSKYRQRGAYHYDEFSKPTTYRAHVLDLVERVIENVPKALLLPTVIEIGAGEGLILSELQRQGGFVCEGCDVDPEAVSLAAAKGNRVRLGTVDVVFPRREADVVLLCDVLEHVKDPIMVMARASDIGHNGIVVIATPDRNDPHAIHEVTPEAIKSYMKPNNFKRIHQSQRHARHLLIFVRE